MITYKVISNFPNYEVSYEGGIVRELSTKKIVNSFMSDGRMKTRLHRDGKTMLLKIHRLVAETYHPNPFYLPEVNHIDGNRLNNDATNLEWSSEEDNRRHGLDMGIIPANKPIVCYTSTGQLHAEYESINQTKKHGFSRSCVQKVLSEAQSHHKGYTFKYL